MEKVYVDFNLVEGKMKVDIRFVEVFNGDGITAITLG